MAGKKIQSAKRKRFINNSIVHVILAILAVIWVFPIVWVVLTSFRAEQGSYVSTFLPQSYTLDNYIRLFTDTTILNFPQMFMNTLFIAVFSCILSTFYVLAVSYCLSRLRFKLRKPYMNMAMILGLFPGFMSMIAVYFILKAIGLTEGNLIKLALILVYSGGAGLSFQIAKGFFDTVPFAVDEAALLDGCTRWQIFTKITLPLSKPIVIYTVLTAFMSPWLDFIFAKVICRANSDQYTIAIVSVGKIKEKYLNAGIAEYAKRLSRYCKLTFCQVADEKTPDRASDALNEQIKDTEGQRLLKRIREQDYVIALAIDGNMVDSVELSRKIGQLGVEGRSSIAFVIGGSLGLSDAVLQRADYRLSFSRMTFPHQLMQMILLEQIYRGFRILNNEPYHK